MDQRLGAKDFSGAMRAAKRAGDDAIAIVKNLDQALTLQDTLNLANGDRPSRRLLDAIYCETTEIAESVTRPHP